MVCRVLIDTNLRFARNGLQHRNLQKCQVQGHHGVAAVGGSKGLRVVAGLGVGRAVPSVVVAGGGFDKLSHRVENRQMQRHHAVAASRVREDMYVVATLREVRVLVPVEAVASNGGGIARVGVVDGQMQRHHRVATGRIRERVGVVAGRGEVLTIPVKTTVNHSRCVSRRNSVHRQSQRDHTVACTRTDNGVEIHLCSDLRCHNCKTIFIVIVTLADGSRKVRDRFAAHRKMQDHRAVATVDRLQVQLIVARRTDIESILIVDLARANLRRNFRSGQLIQRKDQDSRVSTSVGIRTIIIVCAGLCDSGIGQRPVVLDAASVHGGFRVSAVVDREVERYHTITAIGGSEGLRVVARLRVNQIVPNIAAAGGDFDKLSHRVVDREVQGNYRIAAIGSSEGLRVVAGLGVCRAVPRIAVAGGGFDQLSHRVVHRQMECHHAVATRRIRECMHIVAT